MNGQHEEARDALDLALAIAEQRLALALEAAGGIVYDLPAGIAAGRFRNARWAGMLGYRLTELPSEQDFARWLDQQVHPEDRARRTQRFEAFIAGGSPSYAAEFRVRHRDGHWVWMGDFGRAAAHDPSGRVTRVAGVILDLRDRPDPPRERRRGREPTAPARKAPGHPSQEQLLMKEVEHRTKNMLATVQSIVQLTRRTSGTVEAYADTLIGRIRAMSRAHDLLSRQHWHGARLHDLVRAELGAYPDPDGARAAIAGDDPLVTPRAAQTLSLALHELATNAARYGALSAPGGRVTFRSAVHLASAPSLALEWLESGGPPVAPPTRSGFGRLVLERSVAHDLGGEAQLEFAPAGVRYQVRAPLAGVALVEDDGRDAEREAVSWRQS